MNGRVGRRIRWARGTREALRSFPENVRMVFGRALFKAQLNKRHRSASPMKGRLRGVVKLSTDESGNTYRVYYTLKCPKHIYVLYCHKKKSTHGIGIPAHQEDLIVRRLRDALLDCEDNK